MITRRRCNSLTVENIKYSFFLKIARFQSAYVHKLLWSSKGSKSLDKLIISKKVEIHQQRPSLKFEPLKITYPLCYKANLTSIKVISIVNKCSSH